jgi:hypothetical protein
MKRRHFLHSATASILAADGLLPLLAAEPRQRQPGRRRPKAGSNPGTNIFTEPPAIEPLTGYLPKFKPAATGTMRGAFSARYALVTCNGSGAKSRNGMSGSIDVAFSGSVCKTTETRAGTPSNIIKTRLTCTGALNTTSEWTLSSTVTGNPDLRFVEKGTWDDKTMVVQSKSWKQKRSTRHPLIGRWALLPLLASGKLKSKPLTFDMLDDSTLRADQTLRYSGEIEIPVAGGKVRLESYAQTGQGIVPTHYLVDREGRVQLISQTTVNWALSACRPART